MAAPKLIETPPGAIREPTPSTTEGPDNPSLSTAGQCRLSLPTPCGTPAPCGTPCELRIGPERHAVVDLGHLARMAVMAMPGVRGSFRQQAEELFAQVLCIVGHHPTPLTATTMMVFLRNGADEAECEEVLRAWFGNAKPVTTFVVQPPCCGAALGVELWALGGPGVTVERFGPELLTVESDGIRWIHCGGIRGEAGTDGAYAESLSAFHRMQTRLAEAGVGFDQVVRTWLYVNHINSGSPRGISPTETQAAAGGFIPRGEAGRQRYQEMNRARTDFYRDIHFGAKARTACPPRGIPDTPTQMDTGRFIPRGKPQTIYPASTGIGTGGTSITMSCMALDSQRPDVFLLPLENPQQTPAYDYHATHSPQSPKFSRAMAVVQGHFVATLMSGTASIVNSRTCHPGDIVRQTEQTIENIERLIAPANFARHGLSGTGATLSDIAKLRVYVKRREDYEQCREVCERRLPRVPAIYLHADVCRPELLVEIEAVAFSPFTANVAPPQVNGQVAKGMERPGNHVST